MLDKKLAFKIVVKTFNFARFGRTYNISKLTDNVDIISALEKIEKKMRIEQVKIQQPNYYKMYIF